ncbi:DOMON domain protein, partial [Ancylostoma caninum]
RYPAECVGDECEYTASWSYDGTANDVRFEISSKNIGGWTGIGFSKDGQMTNSDIYTGWVFEGKAFVTDRFAYGRQLPAIDPADRQDIYDIGGKIEDETQVS